MLDVAIIGAGPAALSAALYLARAGLKVKAFERGRIGGALSETANIANYPGFLGAGPDLAEKFRQQATEFGAEIDYGECSDIAVVTEGGQRFFRLTIDEELVLARAVLMATGSEPRQLDFIPAAPVSYCALCDADFATNKHTAVIGGANSAVQEAIYLSKIVKDLTLITHSTLKAEPALQETLRQLPNVTIREHVEPTADLLSEFEYIFVFIGKIPATQPLRRLSTKHKQLLDAQGFIQTGLPLQGNDGANADDVTLTFVHETSIPGLFAAGDVRANTVHQVVTAAGDGAAAATEIIKYLQN